MVDVIAGYDKSVHGRRYEDETQARAFELWALTCSRSPAKVAAALTEEGVSESTVRRWALEGNWAGRVGGYLRTLAPGLHEQQLADLFLGRGEALQILRAIATDESQATKDRLTAAIALVDRGGLSHVGTKADPTSNVTASSGVDDDLELEGLSVPELMALEAKTRGKKNGQG